MDKNSSTTFLHISLICTSILKICSRVSAINLKLLLLFLMIQFSTLLFAQDSDCQPSFEPPKSSIDRLRGGIMGMNFKWSGAAFSGLGTRADAMGGSISTLYPGAESISSNPAGLGFARGFSITFDWSPPLVVDPGGIIGIEDKVNDALLQTAEESPPRDPETGEFLAPETAVEDASVNSNLDMRGGLKGGAVMYGTPVFAVAAAFHQPLRLESQINMSGIEFLAAAYNDDGDETHRIFGTINGNFNMNLNVETSSIGFGTRLLPNLALGLVYDNFNGDMTFESTFLPEGIISSASGDTRAFNDAAKTQYDSLFATARGDWEGNGIRMRGGLGYHPKPNISLDLTFSAPFTIDLRGPSRMVHNNIRALNLNPDCDEEVFNIDTLVVDNLTKTQRRETSISGLDLQVPGHLSLGFSTEWDNFLASVVYTRYFDHLGYQLAYTQTYAEVDTSGPKISEHGDIHQGVDLGSAFRLGIGVEQLIIGVGFVLGKTFREENMNAPGKTPDIAEKNGFFLPFFSLGGGVDVGAHFRLDYAFSLYNSSFLRFSTTYRL